MSNWKMVYERQPPQLDAILLLVALILHTPLMLIHMKAPPKTSPSKPFARLTNIDFIEEQIKKRKQQPLVLPPKIPEPSKQLTDVIKKVQEVKEQMFKRSLPPPPPPKPKIQETIIKGPEVGKLQENLLKDKINPDKKTLEGKTGFQSRPKDLSAPQTAREIKIGGGKTSIETGTRLSGLASSGGAGGPLKGKSGFRVSQDAMPESIGGGDDLGLTGGGGSNIVVLPTGAKAKSDASILSPVVKDKGSLSTSSPAGGRAGGVSGEGPGLAGTDGASSLAPIGGASRLPSALGGAVPSVQEGKKFSSHKQLPDPLTESAKEAESRRILPTVASLPRRVKPRVERPLFLITGPLANRKVVSREVPEYPEWARARGLEAAVTLRFTVSPEGAVKNNILVVRTSGYPQLDDSAIQALLQWKFVPLSPDQFREEIGTITFNFSIR